MLVEEIRRRETVSNMIINSMSRNHFLRLLLLAFLNLIEIISYKVLGIVQSFLLNIVILINFLHLSLFVDDVLRPLIGLGKQQLFFLNFSIRLIFFHVFVGDFIEVFLNSFALKTLVWLLSRETSKVI